MKNSDGIERSNSQKMNETIHKKMNEHLTMKSKMNETFGQKNE